MSEKGLILIVDDDHMLAESVQAILMSKGYEDVQITTSATKALEYLETSSFDVALLDIMMPEMSGFELMDSLEKESLDTLFIIMTGDNSIEYAIEAVRRGASDYIRKPFEPDELLMRIENVLRQKRANDDRKRIEEEKRQLESQLIQSQKMEAIGTLSGGIAHDFNNTLGIIIGNTELALETIEEGGSVIKYLNNIMTASTRAEEMVNRLLKFGRIADLMKKPIDLNQVINESIELLRSSLPQNIKIVKNIPDGKFTIMGDSTQINQIMINLFTNAAHAMHDSEGKIEVRAEKAVLNEKTAYGYGTLTPGNYIELTVADTGKGIDPKIIDRVFDPYFTTKEIGKGTGMGLAVVHGIVANHMGHISVKSTPGKGTEFIIYLPLVDAVVDENRPKGNDTVLKGKERILFVDDESMILDTMKTMMELLGHRVAAFNNSNEAFDEFRNNPGQYDIVITDMSMPDMTGAVLAEKIKRIRKDIPVILCTGFNESIDEAKALQLGIEEILSKPVRTAKLAETIKRVVDKKSSDRRAFERYSVKGDAFVVSDSNLCERFNIIDISKSGLAFKYYSQNYNMDDIEDMSILSGDDFIMDNVTFRTVSDIVIHEDSDYLDVTLRRRGIRFDSLTSDQSEKLDYFIRNHTAGLVN